MSEKIMKRNGELLNACMESNERVRLLEKENQELKAENRELKIEINEIVDRNVELREKIEVLSKENQELKNQTWLDTSGIRTLEMMLDDIVSSFEKHPDVTVDDRLMKFMRPDMESVVIRYRKYLRKRGR